MIHKNRQNRRYRRRSAIKRKLGILRCHFDTSEWLTDSLKGQLAKGKVHCSCSLCSSKSTSLNSSHGNRKSSNKRRLYKAGDRRKFESMNYRLKEDKDV